MMSSAIGTYFHLCWATKGNSDRLHVWESLDSLGEQLKRGLLMSGIWVSVRQSLAFEGSIISLDEKGSLK